MEMYNIKQRKLLCLLCLVLFSGCVAGPDFKRPEPPDVTGYLSSPAPALTTSTPVSRAGSPRIVHGLEIDSEWWRILGSEALNALVREGLENNPTLDAAEATLRQAQERHASKSGAIRYPQVDAGVNSQRQRSSPGALGQPGETREFSLYDAGLGVAYTFDLSGGNRRALEALAARSDFAQHQLDGARLTLVARITSTAVLRASLSRQIEVLENIVHSQDEQMEIVHARVWLGNADEDEVRVIRTQLENTRADLALLRNAYHQNEHLLGVLVGRSPGGSELPRFALEDFTLPSELPLLVPSELVRARPDILASESLLHAANAEYGVAVSNLYPQLSITGNLGSQALSAGALFGDGSAVWSLVAQLTQPLFKPGLQSEKRAALAAFDAAAANYRAVVLESLRDVADVLRALENDSMRLAALSAAEIASQESLESATRRYTLGATSYYEILVVQQQRQRFRRDRAAAQARQLNDSIALFQAMGAMVVADDEGSAAGRSTRLQTKG